MSLSVSSIVGGGSASGFRLPGGAGLASGANLADSASLLAAALDLKLVDLLVNAIRTADLSSALAAGPLRGAGVPTPALQPLPTQCCAPAVDGKDRPARLEPYFEPRPLCYVASPCRGPIAPVPVVEVRDNPAVVKVPECELPFQPPWKVLPWQNPPHVVHQIKVVARHSDVIRKGSTIDLFI